MVRVFRILLLLPLMTIFDSPCRIASAQAPAIKPPAQSSPFTADQLRKLMKALDSYGENKPIDRAFAASLGLRLSTETEVMRQLIYDREREDGTLRLFNKLKNGEFLFVRKVGETLHVYRTTADFRLVGAALKRPNSPPVSVPLRDAAKDMSGEFAAWREATGKL
jgi:hypothetical protein